jgi:hypothetical protein
MQLLQMPVPVLRIRLQELKNSPGVLTIAPGELTKRIITL